MNVSTEAGAEAAGSLSAAPRLSPIEALVGSERFPVVFARAAGLFGLVGAGIGLIALGIPHPAIPGLQAGPVAVVLAAGVVLGFVVFVRPSWFPPPAVRGLIALAAVMQVVAIHFLGPSLEAGLPSLALAGASYPMWLGTRRALLPVAITVVGYAVVVSTRGGYGGAAARAFAVGTTIVLGAALLSWITSLIRNLKATEEATHRALEAAHAELARAHQDLADLNRNLEARVVAQVGEIESLNRLRRFLSPQVAEALLTSGDEAILQPHRRQIAVFFCDLRGFTSFASGAEPEEVVEALDDYYKVVGEVLRRHDATVGTFAGDGIMAYLNDPVPCTNPAGTAVQMAMELRPPMTDFMERWKRRGFNLGYGIGIAYGYATLGTIGFEGRNDYTALGSVVNLAARLCGEAGAGEVLTDSRTADALDQDLEVAERQVILKGFPTAITAFEVVG